ncbi:helix-turn-helix domain-containing protein [Lysinibacillus pakistanensis]|uniref:helix-turn-helix domain-containing protein n=1 Tax=Lysinibacillus pakistanensis TaxID=759811 RepID=UPI003D2912DC
MKVFSLEFIKLRRQELNMTLQEAANAMEMKNASTYLKYENGVYAFKADQLPLLASMLKCSEENFFIFKIAKTAI